MISNTCTTAQPLISQLQISTYREKRFPTWIIKSSGLQYSIDLHIPTSLLELRECKFLPTTANECLKTGDPEIVSAAGNLSILDSFCLIDLGH